MKFLAKLKYTLLLAGLTLALAFAALLANPALSLPDYGPAPSFALTNQDGKEISNKDLRGNVLIVDFFFTRCSGVCPMMTSRMYQLQEKIKKVYLISVTSDPDHDSPARLKAYADMAQADPKRWHFLTGSRVEVNRLASGLKFSSMDEPVMHSTRFVLIGKHGHVRGYYDSEDDAAMRKLMGDAKSLTRMP